MQLKIIRNDISLNEPIAVMNSNDCLKLGVDITDRILIIGKGSMRSKVMISDSFVKEGTIVLPEYVMERCKVSVDDMVEVSYSNVPDSVKAIKRKIDGMELSYDELKSITDDIHGNYLSDAEILSFVSAFNVNNSSMREIADLTRCMALTGTMTDMGMDQLYDFHSLGGVPGNKITPIVVSILACEGIHIPKMSSRAVSSACGTSDFVDTFCDVEIEPDRLIEITRSVGGVFACGNKDHAPVGSIIIKAERPMGIDPRPMMLASIMSKKVAIGITHLLVDIPVGASSKIKDMDTAYGFADDLIELGSLLGMHVECAISRAEQPIGRAIGPILEAKECIKTLEDGGGHISIVDKACGMAGALLEMAGIPNGKKRAMDDLSSGRAYTKFMEIVKAQNGDPDIRSDDLIPGKYHKDIHSKHDGYVHLIDNYGLVAIAKGAGAPFDIGAGIILHHKRGNIVKEGDTLFTIYAENQAKLDRSVDSARSRRPLKVSDDYVEQITEDMIIEIVK